MRNLPNQKSKPVLHQQIQRHHVIPLNRLLPQSCILFEAHACMIQTQGDRSCQKSDVTLWSGWSQSTQRKWKQIPASHRPSREPRAESYELRVWKSFRQLLIFMVAPRWWWWIHGFPITSLIRAFSWFSFRPIRLLFIMFLHVRGLSAWRSAEVPGVKLPLFMVAIIQDLIIIISTHFSRSGIKSW